MSKKCKFIKEKPVCANRESNGECKIRICPLELKAKRRQSSENQAAFLFLVVLEAKAAITTFNVRSEKINKKGDFYDFH